MCHDRDSEVLTIFTSGYYTCFKQRPLFKSSKRRYMLFLIVLKQTAVMSFKALFVKMSSHVMR